MVNDEGKKKEWGRKKDFKLREKLAAENRTKIKEKNKFKGCG